MIVAFEGLDLRARIEQDGRKVHSLSFPDYDTPIGQEIAKALAGEREFGPDVMQLLYVANRCEYRPKIDMWMNGGGVVVCDRYRASSIAYGEAQGLDPAWLEDIQRYLPKPTLTVLLDIAPETAVQRKSTGRDRYERDLSLLARVRESYRRQAQQSDWVLIDGEMGKDDVRAAIDAAVLPRIKVG
jgi:dTMP kinase